MFNLNKLQYIHYFVEFPKFRTLNSNYCIRLVKARCSQNSFIFNNIEEKLKSSPFLDLKLHIN